jgi:adenylate cyclase
MSRLSKAILLGVLLGFVGLLASFFHSVHEIEEDAGLGLLFAFRGFTEAPADVVVVSIDKESSERLRVSDDPDRWPRSLHARLIESLASQGAAVVTFDVYFVEPRLTEEDAALAEAVRKAGNVVLAEPLRAREVPSTELNGFGAPEHRIVKIVKPLDFLLECAAGTAPFVLPRMPLKVNQYWTFQPSAGDSPTFPVVAFQLFTLPLYEDFRRLLKKAHPDHAEILPEDARAAIASGGVMNFIRRIRRTFENDPLLAEKMLRELDRSDFARADAKKHRLLKSLINLYGGANRRYLNFYGPPRTITTLPFHEAVAAGNLEVNGKAVFVGLSEVLLTERQDNFYTVFARDNGVFISGVEIAATAFSNLLEDATVNPISSQRYLVVILVWGILIGSICKMTSTPLAALATLSLACCYFFLGGYQFKTDGTWYPIAVPLFLQAPLGFFGAALWNYIETNKERQNMRKALRYYVPSEIVNELATNAADVKQGGQMVYGACLFTDAAGYTTVAEKMGPRELRDFMHPYFEAIFEPIRQNGGMVVGMEGDSTFAIWKGVGPDAALQRQVCQAALGVARAVNDFNRAVDELKLPTRVGVHAGPIFMSHIGAGEHYQYGATGDTVTTASRLDGLNKHLGTEILVSEEITRDLSGFVLREAGRFLLKGKAQPVTVYELLCRAEECRDDQKRGCEIFSDALQAFRRRSWDAAQIKFEESNKILGEDRLSKFYLKLCEDYRDVPPGESWQGIIPLEEK